MTYFLLSSDNRWFEGEQCGWLFSYMHRSSVDVKLTDVCSCSPDFRKVRQIQLKKSQTAVNSKECVKFDEDKKKKDR